MGYLRVFDSIDFIDFPGWDTIRPQVLQNILASSSMPAQTNQTLQLYAAPEQYVLLLDTGRAKPACQQSPNSELVSHSFEMASPDFVGSAMTVVHLS